MPNGTAILLVYDTSMFVLMSSSVGVHADLTDLSQVVGEDTLVSPNTAPHNTTVPLAQMKGSLREARALQTTDRSMSSPSILWKRSDENEPDLDVESKC